MRLGARLAAVLAALVGVALTTVPTSASAVAKPGSVVSVSVAPGAKVGELVVRWKASGSHTDQFRIETALTPFSVTRASGLPRYGRNPMAFTATAKLRAVTLSAAQVRAAGGAPETGNHLYVRVTAVNLSSAGSSISTSATLRSGMARPPAPSGTGSPLRIGSFNVRSAYYDDVDRRKWKTRAADVAAEIVASKLGVAGVQELSPGRSDGRSGNPSASVPRQTDSLLRALAKAKGSQYQLVRTTQYVRAGTPHGSQATRILYDSSRYALLGECAETTGMAVFSPSCSFELPILSTDGEKVRRTAAYAEFVDLSSGMPFLFVSVHLDPRQSKNLATQRRYDDLRGQQAAETYRQIAMLRTGAEPVVIAGDFNSAQTQPVGNAAHDYLVAQGFYDTANASRQVDLQYSTFNGFKTVQAADPAGFGRRIDAILVLGMTGASRFENVTQARDTTRASDHNLITADVVVPPLR